MDLARSLGHLGFAVERYGTSGPDFRATRDGVSTLIEAVVPAMGDGADRVPSIVPLSEMDDEPVAQPVPHEQIVVRYANALAYKLDQFERAASLDSALSSEPYIVALNGCRIWHGILEQTVPNIVKTVFGIGREVFAIDTNTHEMVDSYHEDRPSVQKRSGADVSTDVFLSSDYRPISAVLFANSLANTRPTPYCMDFKLVHNPLALNPVSRGLIGVGEEFSWSDDAVVRFSHENCG